MVRAPRLLLINPKFKESFWSFRWALDEVLDGKSAVNPPLGLATIAALTPKHWDVRIVDENVEPIPLDPDVDIVGICGMAIQFPRQRALIQHYKTVGRLVVAGGSYASLCPEAFEGLADVVVSGEAEYIWPRFCADYTNGHTDSLYHETGEVNLADSPVPRFDLLKLDRYTRVSLQFSRGCPYQCEFCDIIVMFGRRPRTKNPEQIGRELDELRAARVHNVFFVDDNFIGHRPRTKALLSYLADYQWKHDYRFQFGVQASVNLADDNALLNLFGQANVSWVFIGIESPDAESLAEANKRQNLKGNLLSAVHKLYRNGIDVFGGFIIGFDNDTVEVFDKQYDFIVRSGIQIAMVGLLTALPKTPLYHRLDAEGRLVPYARADDNTQVTTNFVPKGMTAHEMSVGFVDLHRRLTRDRVIAERIINKTRFMKHRAASAHYRFLESLGILKRFVLHGVLAGGHMRIYHVARTLWHSNVQVWSVVIADWISGLALARYVEMRLTTQPGCTPARTSIERLKQILARVIPDGDVAVDSNTWEVSITLARVVETRLFKELTQQLAALARSGTNLRIRLDERCTVHPDHLNDLLNRLSKYGDRITLSVHEVMWPFLRIDITKFHLALYGTYDRP